MFRHPHVSQRSKRISFIVTALAPISLTFGSEYQQLENIAPESAEEIAVGLDTMGDATEERPRRRLLRDVLAKAHPFWRDSSLDLSMRAYDFHRENGMENIAEALATGTELTFLSGKWDDRLSGAVSWHTSFSVDTPGESGETGLLAPDQSDLSVISRAYLQYDFREETTLRLFRQDFNIPYINRQDSRMIPNTHEAFVVRQLGKRFEWIIGQVTKMKARSSEEFVPMGEIAGAPGDNSGTTIAGARYNFADETKLGMGLQYTNDLFATAYSEASYKRTLTGEWGMQGAAQYTNQWSTGREKIGAFDTYSWGLRGAISYRGAVLTYAHTRTGDAEIRKPFGGTPGFTSSMIFDFDRANEVADRIGLSQNFAKYGLPGASLIVQYTRGRHAETDAGAPLFDEHELAVTADFRPQKGLLEGFWLRIRYADGDRGSPETDRRDVRVIVNYSVGALR